jgi:hypothetical protein
MPFIRVICWLCFISFDKAQILGTVIVRKAAVINSFRRPHKISLGLLKLYRLLEGQVP